MPERAPPLTLDDWDDRLAVWHFQCDSEHRHLFQLANRLQQLVTLEPADRPALDQTLAELMAALRLHFDREEDLMEQARYPATYAHRQTHRAQLGEIEAFLAAFSAGRAVLEREAVLRLKRGLVRHIQGEDFAFDDHLEQLRREEP